MEMEVQVEATAATAAVVGVCFAAAAADVEGVVTGVSAVDGITSDDEEALARDRVYFCIVASSFSLPPPGLLLFFVLLKELHTNNKKLDDDDDETPFVTANINKPKAKMMIEQSLMTLEKLFVKN